MTCQIPTVIRNISMIIVHAGNMRMPMVSGLQLVDPARHSAAMICGASPQSSLKLPINQARVARRAFCARNWTRIQYVRIAVLDLDALRARASIN